MNYAGYLPFGPSTGIAIPNPNGSVLSAIGYDSRYRPTGISWKQVNGTVVSPVENYFYNYDSVGNITQLQASMAGTTRTFSYDDLNRLTSAITDSSLWGTMAYSYDAMGNMLRRSISRSVAEESGGPPTTFVSESRSFTYQANGTGGNLPKLQTVTENGLDHSVAYDAAGNETGYLMSRTYSPRNLLASVQDSWEMPTTHKIAYAYDGRGVRVQKAESPTGFTQPTATRDYIYSPELRLLSVSRPNNPTIYGKRAVVNDVLNAQYDIVWFGGIPVAHVDYDTGTTRTTLTDHLGTPIIQFDSSGFDWRPEYEPFGDIWQMRVGNATDQPLRFPGQERAMDWEGSEEDYNIFRWYRSGWGRYTQADPLAVGGLGLFAHGRMTRYEVPSIHKSQNHDNAVKEWGVGIYSYAADNPIIVSDPAGLKALRCRVYTLISSPNRSLRGKCVMLGECESIFNPYDKYVTFATIYIPSCWSCPKKCTFEAHGDGPVWMDPATNEWDCKPWTPIYRSKEGPLDGEL